VNNSWLPPEQSGGWATKRRISVKGWDRGDVLIRARIQTAGTTQNEADELAKQIRIETSGSKVFADGPARRKDYQWDVSYEIFVPKRSDLSLETHNGGISISEVRGRIDFSALNGGVVLRKVGGTVHGSTTNGGLVIELDGIAGMAKRWMSARPMRRYYERAGKLLGAPRDWHCEWRAQHRVSRDGPGRISRELAVNLGSGGATVRAMTTNGREDQATNYKRVAAKAKYLGTRVSGPIGRTD